MNWVIRWINQEKMSDFGKGEIRETDRVDCHRTAAIFPRYFRGLRMMGLESVAVLSTRGIDIGSALER